MNGRTRRVGAHLHVQGARFSPKRAEAEIGIDFGPTKNEPGDIGKKGSFAGKPIPYGAAAWEFDWESSELLPEPFAAFEVPHLHEKLIALGAESVTLFIYVGYTDQCNLELSPPLLEKLARLGVTVAISCYEDDED